MITNTLRTVNIRAVNENCNSKKVSAKKWWRIKHKKMLKVHNFPALFSNSTPYSKE